MPTGFEPVNIGFADRRLKPLGYGIIWRLRRGSNPQHQREKAFASSCTGWHFEPVKLRSQMAQRVGFEPTAPCGVTSFQDWLLKPARTPLHVVRPCPDTHGTRDTYSKRHTRYPVCYPQNRTGGINIVHMGFRSAQQ